MLHKAVRPELCSASVMSDDLFILAYIYVVLYARFDAAAKSARMLASTGKETVRKKFEVQWDIVVVGLFLSSHGIIIYDDCYHTSISTACWGE